MEYRYGSHRVYKIEYHFVFVTKYRYKVLKADVGLKVRELIKQTCEGFEIEIIKGVVSQDHAHIFVSAPRNLALSEIMRRIKRKFFRFQKAILGATLLGKRLLLCRFG